MRTVPITVYTAAELRRDFPSAFERARIRYAESCGWEAPWEAEIWESAQALFRAGGVEWPRNGRDGIVRMGDAGDLRGSRAFAWIENRILSPLRIPYRGPDRWRLSRYGDGYRAGCVKPCPFTGYCADDHLLDQLRKAVRSGDSLREAFEAVISAAVRLEEAEREYAFGDEGFVDAADSNGWEFREDGTLV